MWGCVKRSTDVTNTIEKENDEFFRCNTHIWFIILQSISLLFHQSDKRHNKTQKMPPQTGYGSVQTTELQPPAEDTEAQSNFQESDMLYVRERKLTKQEKIRKLTLLAVPLIIASIIVLTIVSFLLKDFGHLYPGRGAEDPSRVHALDRPPTKISGNSDESGSSSSSVPLQPRGPTIPKATDPTPPTSSSVSKEKSSSTSSGGGDASCSSHKACEKLELTGDCCPSVEGIMRKFLQTMTF